MGTNDKKKESDVKRLMKDESGSKKAIVLS
jgi:hypothetical protein